MAASIAILGLPGVAQAEYLVPPDNSAATQYTESVPTAGGHRNAELNSDGARRAPSRVLGKRNSDRLEAQGRSGQEAAEFAAETAPPAVVTGQRTPESSNTGRGRQGDGDDEAETVTTGSGGNGPGGKGALGEVAAQATGVRSRELGLWLPLAMLATALWAATVALRRRPVAPRT